MNNISNCNISGMNSQGSLSPLSSCSLSPPSGQFRHLTSKCPDTDSVLARSEIVLPDMCPDTSETELMPDTSEPYLETWNPIYKEITDDKYDDLDMESEVNETPDISIGFVSFRSEECEGSYPYSGPDSTLYKDVNCEGESNVSPERGRFRRSSLKCSAVKMVPFNPHDDEVGHACYAKQSSEYEDNFSYLYTLDDLRAPQNLMTKKSQQLPVSATFSQSRPLSQLKSALKQFKQSTSKSRQDLTNLRPDDLLSSSISHLRPSRMTNVRRAEGWRQEPPAQDPGIENKWKELSKSLASLKLCKTKLDKSETNLSSIIPHKPELITEDNKGDAHATPERERSKSLFMLDRIRQEEGRETGKVN